MTYRRLCRRGAPSFLDVDPALLQVVLSLLDCDVRAGEFETLAAVARVCRQWHDEVQHAAATHLAFLATKSYETIPSLAPYVTSMIGAMRLCRRHDDVASLARSFTTTNVVSRKLGDLGAPLEMIISDFAIAVVMRDIEMTWESVPVMLQSRRS